MTAKKIEQVSLNKLKGLVRRLRAPDGCPWDRTQEIKDLRQYILEECYEVLDAMDRSHYQELKEELGDLLFHIVFISEIAEENGLFDLLEVIGGVYTKMRHRHPHVFGDATAEDVESVKKNWWKMKQDGGRRLSSMLESVPRHLPALQRAYRLSQRASQVGLDWPGPKEVMQKVKEELGELEQAIENNSEPQINEEIGDLFFAFASLARFYKINPEESLQKSNQKFLDRFSRLEQQALKENRPLETLSPQEMNQWWEAIKNQR